MAISYVQLVTEYLKALSDGEVGNALGRFFDKDALQVEFPNKLNPAGGTSDLETLKIRSEKGKQLLSSQTYIINSIVSECEKVAVEATWNGVLAVPLGELPVGYEMQANFAMFFTFRDGKILTQHNYDCFQPW